MKRLLEVGSLPWAQEVWSSNLHAPTTFFSAEREFLPQAQLRTTQ